MRISIILALVFSLVSSCGKTSQKIIKEIRNLEYQRDADPIKFINWLNSDDEDLRGQAIESLGRIQDTATISLLKNQLTDENERIREITAFAIGQFFSEKAEKFVLEALPNEKSKLVKARLIEASAKVGTANTFLPLINFLKSDTPEYQKISGIGCGILAYRGFPPLPNASTLINLFRTTDDPEVRWSAVYGLFRIGSPVGFKMLTDSLKTVDELSRFFILRLHEVITGLMKSPDFKTYRNFKAVKEVLRIIQSEIYYQKLSEMLDDPAWYNRMATIQIIANLTPTSLISDLQECALDEHPYIRSSALQALANYRNNKVRKILREHLINSENWRDSGTILTNLAKNDYQYILNIIENSYQKLEWPKNYYHIEALDIIQNKKSTEILKKLTNTDNIAQLTTVLESLVNRTEVPISLFLNQLELNDPAVTTIVSKKLSQLKDKKAIDLLIECYQNFIAPKDLEPMLAIIVALDSIGSNSAVAHLEKQLQSPYHTIREAAAHALSRITKRSYKPDYFQNAPVTKHDFSEVNPDIKPKVQVTTSKGEFRLLLFPEKAPITVANFIELVNSGFYNGNYFHRVVPGFVIQAGDPRGDGWGGPPYSIPCEYNDIFYERGVVGMAHAGKDTGGSQFFITHTPQPHLNGRHTAFGKVVAGMDVIDRIEIYDQIIKAVVVSK
jgi:cyclophilin family peptidyl-prolyl cis-trans isomerase/HEAT repeat protein